MESSSGLISRRVTAKIGDNDLGSIWAKASLAQYLQHLRQLELGRVEGSPVSN